MNTYVVAFFDHFGGELIQAVITTDDGPFRTLYEAASVRGYLQGIELEEDTLECLYETVFNYTETHMSIVVVA